MKPETNPKKPVKPMEPRDLLDGKSPFVVALRQTAQRDQVEVFTSETKANEWCKKHVASGGVAFILKPTNMVTFKPAEVDATELDFSA